MRNIHLAMLITLFALCGCQAMPPQEARMSRAVVSETSSRSAQQVSDCIYHGWSTTHVVQNDPTTHIELEKGRMPIFTWQDSMFADVYPRGAGSEVRFYKTFNMGPEVLADRSSIVKLCA